MKRGGPTQASVTQHVFDREYFAYGLEREVLVVHNHVVLPLGFSESLDVGEHGNGHYYLTPVGEEDGHCTSLDVEVKFFDAEVCVFILAHRLSLFDVFNLNFFACEYEVNFVVELFPVFVDDRD